MTFTLKATDSEETSLCDHQPTSFSKHELTKLAQQEQSQDIVHTINYQGESFTYDTKDLYWNTQSYDYLQKQEKLFNQCLLSLIQKYAGKYIIFENCQVIDFDDDEESLLSRISNNNSYRDRPAIFCMIVPRDSSINTINA